MRSASFRWVAAAVAVACLLLAGCKDLTATLAAIQADLEPLEISTSMAVQNPHIVDEIDRLVMRFPYTTYGGVYDPTLYEYCSQGPTSGATLAIVTVSSNKLFYITGARIENPEVRLTDLGDPAGDGWVAFTYYNPADPTQGHDVLEPVEVAVSLDPANNDGLNVIKVEAGGEVNFDVSFGTKLSYWMYTDTDRSGTAFPDDDAEVIQIRASLFLEGYLADGTQFSGAFPPPLSLDIEITHYND